MLTLCAVPIVFGATMCVPVLADNYNGHRCSGERTWLGLDTNNAAQLTDDFLPAGPSNLVHSEAFMSPHFCDDCECFASSPQESSGTNDIVPLNENSDGDTQDGATELSNPRVV
jgi:hypothetical protein